MSPPVLHRNITPYPDVRYMCYDMRRSVAAIRDTEKFSDLFQYFRRYEDSTDEEFIRWLQGYGVVKYDNNWDSAFRKEVVLGSERVKFCDGFNKEMEVLDI